MKYAEIVVNSVIVRKYLGMYMKHNVLYNNVSQDRDICLYLNDPIHCQE